MTADVRDYPLTLLPGWRIRAASQNGTPVFAKNFPAVFGGYAMTLPIMVSKHGWTGQWSWSIAATWLEKGYRKHTLAAERGLIGTSVGAPMAEPEGAMAACELTLAGLT